jgi:hypothetical protein
MRGECDKNMERLKEVEREIEQVPTLQRQLV